MYTAHARTHLHHNFVDGASAFKRGDVCDLIVRGQSSRTAKVVNMAVEFFALHCVLCEIVAQEE